MLGKYIRFTNRMKDVAPHIINIHCIIHRQHLAAKKLGGNMNAPLNLVIKIIFFFFFLKINSLNDRLFHQFCEDKEHETLLMHTEARWLSKGKWLIRIVELWDILVKFLKDISTHGSSNRQKENARAKYIAAIENEMKSKIFYLADVFYHINLLNLYL